MNNTPKTGEHICQNNIHINEDDGLNNNDISQKYGFNNNDISQKYKNINNFYQISNYKT